MDIEELLLDKVYAAYDNASISNHAFRSIDATGIKSNSYTFYTGTPDTANGAIVEEGATPNRNTFPEDGGDLKREGEEVYVSFDKYMGEYAPCEENDGIDEFASFIVTSMEREALDTITATEYTYHIKTPQLLIEYVDSLSDVYTDTIIIGGALAESFDMNNDILCEFVGNSTAKRCYIDEYDVLGESALICNSETLGYEVVRDEGGSRQYGPDENPIYQVWVRKDYVEMDDSSAIIVKHE